MLRTPLLVVALSLCASLDAQWILNPSNNHLYRLNSVKLTWKSAEAQAVQIGGHLATIRSASEHDWLNRNFGSWFWIGMTDERVEGTWEWSSGEAVTYTRWCQPSGQGGPADDYCRIATDCWLGGDIQMLHPSVIELAPKADFSVFGTGCASTRPPPSISSNGLPVLGQQFTFGAVGFLARPQFGQLLIGSSNKSWGFIPLPWDLSVLGMSGCYLLTSIDVSGTMVTDNLGSATARVSIPLDVNLYGAVVYGQVWMPDLNANSLGVATSNAFRAVIGL